MDRYCRRLIEVDFPIKQISKFARDEKNLRNNHPWHLHLWWARRPWGACRAITLAGLLPAPTDEMCSDEFVAKANEILSSVISVKNKTRESLQAALVQFVGVFSAWEMGKQNVYLDVARKLILLASREHRPLVLDSFAGYGAIPGEAARLGCESVAGELNPVALICLKTMLEYIPKHGHGLLDVVAEGATFVQKEARKRLLKYYPMQNGKDPIARLWARTIRCEGPSCGAIIPMISQVVIAKGRKKTWIEITGDAITKKIEVHIRHGSSIPTGLTKTVSGSHAICPVCNFTTNKLNVKIQANNKQMGQRIFGKAMAVGQRQGKLYFDASEEDVEAFNSAARRWAKLCDEGKAKEINEKYPFHDSRAFTAGLYGLKHGVICFLRDKNLRYTR